MSNEPIAYGTVNSIQWRSLTTVWEMQFNVLCDELRKHNAMRLANGLHMIDMTTFLDKRYWPYAQQFVSKINRKDLYLIRSKYKNHKKVKR